MAQVLIRNVDKEAVKRLKARARERGVSLESELRGILEREAMPRNMAEIRQVLEDMDSRTAGKQLADGVELLRKDRGYDD